MMFTIKYQGQEVGQIYLSDLRVIPMLPAYTIWPNILSVKEANVYELLDFELIPTRPVCETFLTMINTGKPRTDE